MREIGFKDMRKRGCQYCLDYQKKQYRGIKKKVCIHDECPYHELDGFRSYNAYLKSKGDLIFLRRKEE